MDLTNATGAENLPEFRLNRIRKGPEIWGLFEINGSIHFEQAMRLSASSIGEWWTLVLPAWEPTEAEPHLQQMEAERERQILRYRLQ